MLLFVLNQITNHEKIISFSLISHLISGCFCADRLVRSAGRRWVKCEQIPTRKQAVTARVPQKPRFDRILMLFGNKMYHRHVSEHDAWRQRTLAQVIQDILGSDTHFSAAAHNVPNRGRKFLVGGDWAVPILTWIVARRNQRGLIRCFTRHPLMISILDWLFHSWFQLFSYDL